MKILHVATRHRRGGAERNLVHFTRVQQADGHEVHLAVGRDSMVADFPPDLPVHEIPELVRSISPASDLAAVRRLRRLIDRERYDVVHTHQSKAGVVGRVAARGRVPQVIHTVHMASFGPGYGRAASTIFLRAERACARFTNVIVCVGDELRDRYIAAGVGRPDQYRVIHSPIDVDHFIAVRVARDERGKLIRGQLAIGGGQVVLTVASLEPRKRVDLIVERLAPGLAPGERTLIIAGDGPERVALESMTVRLRISGAVRFVGHTDDVSGLMAAADVFVHAAVVEGVPQVVLQALAAGLPVVATEVIGLREVPQAPIAIARGDGRDMASLVEAMLERPAAALDPDALGPWTPPRVEAEIRGFDRLVEAGVRA